MLVVRLGVWTVGFISVQLLRGGFLGAVRTLVSLGAQTNVDAMAENGQMSQLNPFAVTVKLGDFLPTDSVYGACECAFDGDDIITTSVHSHFQNPNIGYIQRK